MSGRDPSEHQGDAFQLAMFRALTASFDGYVNCIDRERRILFLNRTLTRDLSNILGRRIEEFITEAHRQAAIDCAERAFQTGDAQQIEYTVSLADSRPRHLLTRFAPFAGPRGEALALQFTTDITERRRLAEELEQSMEFRRRVVENLPEIIALMDRQHRFVWINRVPPHVTLEQVIGQQLDDLPHLAGLEVAHAAIESVFDKGVIEYYEIESRHPEGSRWYGVRVVPIRTERGVENVLLITADLTERKRAEQALREKDEQLHRAQRLESVGQLAGGIAHDFNNLLQVIHGNLSFAKEGVRYGEDPSDDLEQAVIATERAGELTQHLLAIGRRSRLAPKPVVLGALIEQSMRMLRRAIPETIKLVFEPPPAAYVVKLDPPQFEQVLINLCVNARDAMPLGGSIRVRIASDGGSHVLMSVSDTGTGIAPEHLGRIFEPFFTTKGAGSGLGLAVAAGIVAAHGGEMIAESDGQRGTTIKVRLPLVLEAPEAAAPELDGGHGGGAGVILVAEDEDQVRTQVQRILERAGYTILSAPNGVKAVELFRQHHARIDLVLLDVVMPELDGWQAFLQMNALAPGVQVLFTTGYAASVLPADFASHGARLISKPYKRERLLAEVRDIMGARHKSPM
jgi:two-component system cell cycle sensor histidine kinase/response regulator CckA